MTGRREPDGRFDLAPVTGTRARSLAARRRAAFAGAGTADVERRSVMARTPRSMMSRTSAPAGLFGRSGSPVPASAWWSTWPARNAAYRRSRQATSRSISERSHPISIERSSGVIAFSGSRWRTHPTSALMHALVLATVVVVSLPRTLDVVNRLTPVLGVPPEFFAPFEEPYRVHLRRPRRDLPSRSELTG